MYVNVLEFAFAGVPPSEGVGCAAVFLDFDVFNSLLLVAPSLQRNYVLFFLILLLFLSKSVLRQITDR